MSRLEELIAELCPDGVEYKTLGEVATISRGGSFQKKDFLDSGFPCIHYGQIYTQYGLFADKTLKFISSTVAEKQKKAVKNDIVMAVTSENVDDVCKCLAWLGDEEVAVSGHTAIIHHDQNPKYLTYYFHSEMFAAQKRRLAHGTKVMEVTPDKLNDVKIPLPPLEVQREIVRILDAYSEKVAELMDQLAAELDARKRQYEYYRDDLLTFTENHPFADLFPDGVEYKRLGEVATISRGGSFQKKDFLDSGFPCIHYGQIYTQYGLFADKTLKFISSTVAEKQKKAVKNDIVMAVTSENVDDVCKCLAWLGDEEVAVSGHTAIIHHNQNPKYLTYYFHSEMFAAQKRRLAHGTKVIEVTPDKLNDVKIPLPPLAEQERIVSIFDRFDKLCNDISAGIPAEIEARRKQYEHYRDRLLTFKEKTA